MRIVCDNCGAKYQIGDDKVRNKVFKIRCKRCAHVIVVRSSGDADGADQAAAQDEPTRVVKQPVNEASTESAAPADAIWYVVVNRESVGPLTKDQVAGYYSRGEVDGEAFTWAEGMADWTRLASVPEFSHLFPVASPEAEPTVGDGDMRGFAGLDAGAHRGDQDEDDDDVMASNNVADIPKVAGAAAPQVAESPRVSSNLRNQRNENSVLFSLDSLAAEERAPRVSNTGGTEGSGLIDISAILGGGGGGARPAAAAIDDPFGGGGGFAPVSAAPIGAAPMPSLVTRSGPSTGKVVGLTVAVVLLLGGGAAAWWFLTRSPAEVPTVAQNTPPVSNKVTIGGAPVVPPSAPPTAAPSAPPSAAPTVAAAPVSEAAPESAAPAEGADKPKARVPKAAAPTRRTTSRKTAAPSRPAQPDPEDEPPARAERPKPSPRPAKRPARGGGGDELDSLLGSLDGKQGAKRPAGGAAAAPAAGGAADPLLPERLNRDQILHVVRKNAGSIRQCRQVDPNASGTVMVNMLIGRSGQVQRADVDTASFKGTPVGNCVEGRVKAFRFPQFSGEPMRVNMPFAL